MGSDSLFVSEPLRWSVHFTPLTIDIALGILLILLLLFFSSLISGSETDFFSIEQGKKQHLANNKAFRKVLYILENPEKLLATVLLSNTIINVAVVIISTMVIPQTVSSSLPSILEIILLTIFISTFILVFGNILPKVYAHHHPLKIARLMATPLSFLEKILNPFTGILIRSTTLINQRLKKETQKKSSADEISKAMELTSGSDISEEKEILKGIVNFGNKSVSEIMCPRVDVVTVDIKSSFKTVLKVINNSGYSRIPVFSGSFDQIRGILYIKDLLPHTEKGDNFHWQNLLRPPFFVPENKKVKDLLGDFQKNKIHMAIVVDEYGGSSGIVTMEDVLEEIVGDIADEFDEDESFYTRLGDNKFLFDGKILLDKFVEVIGCDKNYFESVKGEAETLAGLILEIKGDIPALHEKIPFRNFRFTIESVTRRRIRQVKTEMI